MKKVLGLVVLLSLISCGKNPNKNKQSGEGVVASKSICGVDDRAPSYDLRVGRGLRRVDSGGGCTVTMISNSCAISVGHCRDSINIVEFNVPASVNGAVVHSDIEDIYTLKKGSLVYQDNGIGKDWAVFKLNPSTYHGHTAGSMQGYYGVDWSFIPRTGSKIRIAGFGLDTEPERNLAQQESVGVIDSSTGSQLFHSVDTMGGNSGSAIISTVNERVIGVHSHGGCAVGSNGGTVISRSPAFIEAIISCVRNDLSRR